MVKISIVCTTLDDLFKIIQWCHDRRREWEAKTNDAGWIIEYQSIENEQGVILFEFDVQDYLDDTIKFWRKKANDSEDEQHKIAQYYIDAFQSARVSLLGKELNND